MKIGFSGTRRGMSSEQSIAVFVLLKKLMPTEFHHGDCVGADEEAHGLAFQAWGLATKRVGHPPEDDALRAFCECDELRDPLPYLDRNRAIVNETEVLIAAPNGARPPILKGAGTWSTVEYARKLKRPFYVVMPDGATTFESCEPTDTFAVTMR